MPFIPLIFVVLAVAMNPEKHNEFGLIVVRPLLAIIMSANGKNFINVTAEQFGGLGVMIVPRLNCCKVMTDQTNRRKSFQGERVRG